MDAGVEEGVEAGTGVTAVAVAGAGVGTGAVWVLVSAVAIVPVAGVWGVWEVAGSAWDGAGCSVAGAALWSFA